MLEKHLPIIGYYASHWPGIYILYHKENPYYVGLATDLIKRFPGHLKDKHAGKWDTFSLFLTLGDKIINDLEVLLLHYYRPPGNNKNMNFRRSINLKPSIEELLKHAKEEEIRILLGKGEGKKLHRCINKPHPLKRKPELASYVSKRFEIRREYKGKLYIAHVRRDGSIRFKNKLFYSPSAAGRYITGHFVNGWYFWKYERADGWWDRLNMLRKFKQRV